MSKYHPQHPHAATGIEIAVRRREKIAAELTGYRKCLDNIRNKLDMTSELEEGGIVEELTEEDVVRGRLGCGRGGNSRGVDRRGRCQR